MDPTPSMFRQTATRMPSKTGRVFSVILYLKRPSTNISSTGSLYIGGDYDGLARYSSFGYLDPLSRDAKREGTTPANVCQDRALWHMSPIHSGFLLCSNFGKNPAIPSKTPVLPGLVNLAHTCVRPSIVCMAGP